MNSIDPIKRSLLGRLLKSPTDNNPYDIAWPQAEFTMRDYPWIYCGWIRKEAENFNALCARAQKSHHGEERQLDFKPFGVIIWRKEPDPS